MNMRLNLMKMTNGCVVGVLLSSFVGCPPPRTTTPPSNRTTPVSSDVFKEADDEQEAVDAIAQDFPPGS